MVVDEAYLVDEAVLPVEEEAVETMEDYSSFNFVGILKLSALKSKDHCLF